MKFQYNMHFFFFFLPSCFVSFMKGFTNPVNNRQLTTTVPFYYTNMPMKCLLRYKTDPKSVKKKKTVHGLTEIAP